jgi:Secretion system C-terminal sorting domain
MKKQKRTFFPIFVLWLFPILAHTQVITYLDSTFGIFAPRLLFGEINLKTCKDSLLKTEGFYNIGYDIMVQSNGDIFGFALDNSNQLPQFNDTIFFQLLEAPQIVYYNPQGNQIRHEIRGLTCDENGVAYSAGRGISRRDPGCCATSFGSCCTKWEETYLGTLPPNMQCLGDITYRKGKFYLSAIGNKLVEVNMKNPSKSKIIYDFPPGTLPIHGLTTVQFSCDSVKTYAIGRAWDHSIIYELNFDNWTLKQICDMPKLAIDGAGNITECALPPCNIFVDLDSDNSSFGFVGDYCADTFCLTPLAIAVADTDVVVLSAAGFIDSITFQLTNTLDGSLEFLTISSPVTNIQASGNGTSTIAFLNNGANIVAFEEALKTVVYTNNASIPTSGTRQVSVIAWANGEASHVSVAELPVCDTTKVAVQEVDQDFQVVMKLQPNPAKDFCIVEISMPDYGETMGFSLTLANATGQIFRRQSISPQTSWLQLDTNDLETGLYFVYLCYGDRVLQEKKLVVQR